LVVVGGTDQAQQSEKKYLNRSGMRYGGGEVEGRKTYIGKQTFFTIINIRDCGFALRLELVIVNIGGKKTNIYTGTIQFTIIIIIAGVQALK
jgi:hypothetical protein